MRVRMKTWLIILCIGLFWSSAYADRFEDAVTKFEVPTVKTINLDISGRDLLRYGDDEDLRINVGSDLFYLSQTPMYTLTLTNQVSLDFGGVPDQRSHTLGEDFQLNYRRYFGNSRGFYVETLGGIDADNTGGDGQDAATMLAVNFGVGAGYGRILDTRTVSQAAAMCKIAGTACNAAKLLAIADVINKNNQGFYAAEYKLDGVRVFYDELTKAVGTTDAFSLNQVLASPLYNITPKRVGFEVGARLIGVHGDLIKEDDTDPDADSDMMIQQYAGYAMMVNPTTNLFIDQTLTHGMKQATGAAQQLVDHPGEKNNVFTVEAGINIDHSYTWASQASIQTNMFMPEEGDTTSNYALLAQTNVAIGVRTVIGGDFMLGNGDSTVGLSDQLTDLGIGDEELHWQFMVNFRHFIL